MLKCPPWSPYALLCHSLLYFGIRSYCLIILFDKKCIKAWVYAKWFSLSRHYYFRSSVHIEYTNTFFSSPWCWLTLYFFFTKWLFRHFLSFFDIYFYSTSTEIVILFITLLISHPTYIIIFYIGCIESVAWMICLTKSTIVHKIYF